MKIMPFTIAALLAALPAAAMAQASPPPIDAPSSAIAPALAPGLIGAPQGSGRYPAVAESRAEVGERGG